MPVFKIKSMEGDNKMKLVHWNMLLPLFSNPSCHTNELDAESMVDQAVNTHGVVVVTTHVKNMSAYCRAWVASLFQQRLQFVTTLFE